MTSGYPAVDIQTLLMDFKKHLGTLTLLRSGFYGFDDPIRSLRGVFIGPIGPFWAIFRHFREIMTSGDPAVDIQTLLMDFKKHFGTLALLRSVFCV